MTPYQAKEDFTWLNVTMYLLQYCKRFTKKFIECPFKDDDIHNAVIGKKNDKIVCLERIDFQVKIHGKIVELGEIENTVKEMEGLELRASSYS
ncbi:hypothetical protein H8356DRAFT_1321627 [Neocallimastix lanati (nom. inval.)]|nr:hypothetical protein H8356DRAFT_1321627 [Neocallimastix sp. JGI-2020a]